MPEYKPTGILGSGDMSIPTVNKTVGNSTYKPTGVLLQDSDKIGYTPMGRSFNNLPYQKQLFEDNKSQYINPNNIEAIKESVAQNQKWFGGFGKAILNQTVVGEMVGGTLESVGALDPRKIVGRINGTKGAFERNMLEEFGQSFRTWAENVTPMYQTKNAVDNLAFGDKTWWGKMIPSMASSLSIMIPAMGVSSAAKMLGISARALKGLAEVKMLGKLGTVVEEVEGLAKISKLGTTAEILANTSKNAWQAAKISDDLAQMSKGLTLSNITAKAQNILIPALASRTIDSSREAVGRYKQYYDSYKANGLDDEKSKELASEAASYGYISSHANIVFDLLEWTVLSKLGSPEKGLFKRQLSEALGRNTKYAEMMGENAATTAGVESFGKSLLKTHLPEFIKVGLSEGFDETSMDFFMDDAKRKTDVKHGLSESNQGGISLAERYIKHHTVAKNWESFIGGFLGGEMMGMFALAKGEVQNHFFGEEAKGRMDNIATSFMERMEKNNKHNARYNDAMANGRTLEASHIKNMIVNSTLVNSALTGSLDLDVEHYENALKLPKEERAKLEMFQDENNQYVEGSENNIRSLVEDLKAGRDIFNREMSIPRTGDKNHDRFISADIAADKVMIMLNNREILKRQKEGDVTKTNIDETLIPMLESYGDNSVSLYNSIKTYEKAKYDTENDNQALTQSTQTKVTENEDLNKQIVSLQEDLKTASKDERIGINNEINKARNNILRNEFTIRGAEKSIILNNSKLEVIKTNHDSFVSNSKLTHSDNTQTFEEQYNKIKKVHDTNHSQLSYLKDNGGSQIESLKKENVVLQSGINNKTSKEYYTSQKENNDLLNKAYADKMVSDFSKTINKLKTKEELDKEFEKTTHSNIDEETITRLTKKYKTKLKEIEGLATTHENVDSTGTSTEVLVDDESQHEKNIKTIELNREISTNNITNKGIKLLGKTLRKDGFRYSYTNIEGEIFESGVFETKELAQESLDKKYDEMLLSNDTKFGIENVEVIEPDTKTAAILAPTGKLSKPTQTPSDTITHKGLAITIGNYYYVVDKSGKFTSEYAHKVESIDFKTGKVTLINSNNQSSVVVLKSQILKTFNNFDTNLSDRVQQHSDTITRDANHIYHKQVNGKDTKSTRTVTSLAKTEYNEFDLENPSPEQIKERLKQDKLNAKNAKTNPALNAGTAIDNLYRDFFEGTLKTASEYGITDSKQFTKIKNYLDTIKRVFNQRGLKVIANGVKLFDTETGIAGEIDLLLMDEANNVFIYDVKSKLVSQFGHGFFDTNKTGYSSFQSNAIQVNVYAALFEKIFKVPVAGLGIIPISVSYDRNSTSKIPSITEVGNAKINEADMKDADELLTSRDGKTIVYKLNPRIDSETGIIMLDNNRAILDNASVVPGKTVLDLLKLNEELPLNENFTTEDLVNKYVELTNYLSKVINEHPNTDIDSAEYKALLDLYTLFTKIFNVQNINGTNTLVPSDFFMNQNDYSILTNDKGEYTSFADILETLYSQNSNYLNGIFENAQLSMGTAYDQLSLISKQLDLLNSNNMNYAITDVQRDVQHLDTSSKGVINAAQNIVYNVDSLLKDVDGINGKYEANKQKHISLVFQLLQLKRSQTLDTSTVLSVSDAINLIFDAYSITNPESGLDIETIMPILLNIQNTLMYLKDDTYNHKELLRKQQEKQFEGQEIHWEQESKVFKDHNTEDGVAKEVNWTNDSAKRTYDFLEELYNNLKVDRAIFNKDGKIHTIYTPTTSEEINEIRRTYNKPTQIGQDDYFNIGVNSELETNLEYDDEGNLKDTDTIEVLSNLQTGNAVDIAKVNGQIEISSTVNGKTIIIGTIKDTSTHIKGLQIVNSNNEYIGFKTLLDDIRKDPKLLNSKVLDYLKELQIARLSLTANNKSKTEIAKSQATYDKLINEIITATNDTLISTEVLNLINKFRNINQDETNDLSKEDNFDSKKESINNILDILFFNNYLKYLESYKPSINDITNRILFFDNITKKNNIKFNLLNNQLIKSKSTKASIQTVSKPSVAIITNGIKPLLKDNILKIDGKIQILNIRGGKQVDARTGTEFLLKGIKPNINNSYNKQDGFYVLLKSTDNSYTLFPVTANTLKDSYKKIGTQNLEDKAVDHVKSVILNIISSVDEVLKSEFSEPLVEGRLAAFGESEQSHKNDILAEIRETINSIKADGKLSQLIIDKNTSENDATAFPYFNVITEISNSGELSTIILYTTNEKVGNKTITYYNNITVTGERAVVSKFDSTYLRSETPEDIRKIIGNLRSYNVSANSYTTRTKLNLSIQQEALNSALDNVGDMLRQTNYNSENGKVEFLDGQEFVDPISGKTYTDPIEYSLDTQSVYNYIAKTTNGKNIISNMNFFGNNPLRFNVDVENVTSIKKGVIDNPLNDIQDNEFQGVIEVINTIDNKVNEISDGNVTATHKGYIAYKETSLNGKTTTIQNLSTIASIKPIPTAKGITFEYKYTDRFIKSLYASKLIDNPLISLLHEHIHSLIISVSHFSKLDVSTRKGIIKRNNDIIDKFINSFETDLNATLYLEDGITPNMSFIQPLLDSLNNGINEKLQIDTKTLEKHLLGFITVVKEDIVKANGILNSKSDSTGDMIAQELFTYFTDPIIMKTLSLVTSNESGFNYTRNENNKETFIDKLVRIISELYNNILKALNIDITQNYAKQVTDILSDLYYAMSTGNIQSEIINNDITTTVVEPSSDITEDTNDLFEVQSLSDINLVNSNNNVIFANNVVNNLYRTSQDDSNLPIC